MPDLPAVSTLLNTFVSVLAGRYVSRWAERRPKLVAYFLHASRFQVRQPDWASVMHTHSIVIWNAGQRTATNVRVRHNFLPEQVNVFPEVTRHEINRHGDGGEILFPGLVPQEQVTISYLYFPPLTYDRIHAGIQHDEGFARSITVIPTRQYPRWVNLMFFALALLGGVTLLYILAAGGQTVGHRFGWW